MSLRVTTILTLIVVIVPSAPGLAPAVLLDRRGWFFNALRSVFFVPVVLSSVAVSLIWIRLLDNDKLLNQALRAALKDHLANIPWQARMADLLEVQHDSPATTWASAALESAQR